MDSERATKRRKLDSPVTHSKKQPITGQSDPTTAANGPRASKAARDAWETAKAQRHPGKKPMVATERSLENNPEGVRSSAVKRTAYSRSIRKPTAQDRREDATTARHPGRTLSVEAERALYDDIDGAHSSPLKRTVYSTRKKVPQDPLRNQRNESASSPATKTTSKGPALLGFFKQFHAPKDRREANRADHIDAFDDEAAVEDEEMIAAPVEAAATPSRKAKPQRSSQTKHPSAKKPRKESFKPDELTEIQSVLLEKLAGKGPVSLTNLDDEYSKVSQLVTQTITAGESNSMLLIGARGSGKTALVDHVLREQAIEHPEDFHVVRLNGFIHTDDKIALREIWRQLGREMEIDEEESTSRNYADTLTTLLALLSHPEEQGRDHSDQVTKSVIVILDEFDLFATHPRQTLLYNLFDIAQSRKAPIAVLGLTTRIDVAESLEKRVKSRFSHRYVHLSLAKSFAAFLDVCGAVLRTGDAWWNGLVVDALLPRLSENLRRIYHTTKSVADFMTGMILPIASLPLDESQETEALIEHLVRSFPTSSLLPPDSKLSLLPSLSTLQLALLICAARQTAIHNTDVVTFALAYEEYKMLASKAKLQASASGSLAQGASARISGKEVARGAWEALVEMGLIVLDGRAGGGRVDVGLDELGVAGVEMGGWGRWCREI
ncbi:hypothetical protein LTR08_007234 [Meristemomyces frigidus]|nr:hypothetical protein LTR08_007234 [Meristemomyces frigidus]